MIVNLNGPKHVSEKKNGFRLNQGKGMTKKRISVLTTPVRRSLRLKATATSTPLPISELPTDNRELEEVEEPKLEENTQNTTVSETHENSTLNCSCSCNCNSCKSCVQKSPISITNLRRKLTQAIERGSCNIMIEKIEKIETIMKNLKQIGNKSNEKQCQDSTSDESSDDHIKIALDSKIDKLLDNVSLSSESDKEERNSLVLSEAEEWEEDTPSEDSNAIIEVGEEIRTESERSSDESYESGSFIDDENDHKLLSGEEYDLSWDSPKKFSRIVKLSSGSEDEIVQVKKREKKPVKKRKKSRIIKFADSSDEDGKIVDENCENEGETQKSASEKQKKIIILENVKVQDIQNKELSEGINQVLKNILSQSSINSASPSDTNLTPNGQVRKKKKKSKKKKKINGSLQLDNKDEEEASSNLQITAKRKLDKSDDSSELQPPLKKKKKNRKRQKQLVEESSQLSLIEEAIKQTPMLEIELTNDWNIEDIQLKSSRSKPSRPKPSRPKPKSEKSPKVTEQFHSKDFRNLMLYDASRNKRTDTKSLLHRKF